MSVHTADDRPDTGSTHPSPPVCVEGQWGVDFAAPGLGPTLRHKLSIKGGGKKTTQAGVFPDPMVCGGRGRSGGQRPVCHFVAAGL
jgi:hypothetical protein